MGNNKVAHKVIATAGAFLLLKFPLFSMPKLVAVPHVIALPTYA